MNAKQFLLIGGIVLLLVGVIGFFGIIGPTPDQSIFGDAWWFDNGENWAHTILGVVALILAFAVPAMVQKWVVVLLGIIGVLVGIYSIFTPAFLGANLENPADSILHLAIGIWALLAAFLGKNGSSSAVSA
ncbi:MAG: hypothetical protein U0517_03020 [Candidatus Andersenbacteria bacterium]